MDRTVFEVLTNAEAMARDKAEDAAEAAWRRANGWPPLVDVAPGRD